MTATYNKGTGLPERANFIPDYQKSAYDKADNWTSKNPVYLHKVQYDGYEYWHKTFQKSFLTYVCRTCYRYDRHRSIWIWRDPLFTTYDWVKLPIKPSVNKEVRE